MYDEILHDDIINQNGGPHTNTKRVNNTIRRRLTILLEEEEEEEEEEE